MKLENDRYEELMIDLALLKKQGQRQQQYSDLNAATLEGVSDKGTYSLYQNFKIESFNSIYRCLEQQ